MDDNILYWLWMQECLGVNSKTKKLMLRYETPEAFYNAGKILWKSEGFSPLVMEKLTRYKPEEFLERVSFCNEHKIKIITPDSEYYPEALLEIENYPLALYVRGNYKVLKNTKAVAVIGSRTPSVYGERAAEKIVCGLVDHGYLVVSGGALGIDSISHKAAVEGGGRTVLIMGCGHGSLYLPENAQLRKLVANNGALVSEYPPLTPVTPGSFQNRNRIISGMSKGVVIVEAAERSGTFNTAKHAKRQKRDLFVLPGDIESGNFAGSNRLITEGALPVFSAEDILFHYGERITVSKFKGEKTNELFPEIKSESEFSKRVVKTNSRKNAKKKKTDEDADSSDPKIEENSQKKEKNSLEGISKNAVIVYNIMSDGICTLDEIKRESGLAISKVLISLTELEMSGIAESDGPNKYRLK